MIQFYNIHTLILTYIYYTTCIYVVYIYLYKICIRRNIKSGIYACVLGLWAMIISFFKIEFIFHILRKKKSSY